MTVTNRVKMEMLGQRLENSTSLNGEEEKNSIRYCYTWGYRPGGGPATF